MDKISVKQEDIEEEIAIKEELDLDLKRTQEIREEENFYMKIDRTVIKKEKIDDEESLNEKIFLYKYLDCIDL